MILFFKNNRKNSHSNSNIAFFFCSQHHAFFFNHELHIDIDENETNNAVHYLDQKRETKERLQCLKFATRPFF